MNALAKDLTCVTFESLEAEKDTNSSMSSDSLQNEQSPCFLQGHDLPADTSNDVVPQQGTSGQSSDTTIADNSKNGIQYLSDEDFGIMNALAEDLSCVTLESIEAEEEGTTSSTSTEFLQNEQNPFDLQEQGLQIDACASNVMPQQKTSTQSSGTTSTDNGSKHYLPVQVTFGVCIFYGSSPGEHFVCYTFWPKNQQHHQDFESTGKGSITKKENQAALCPPCDPVQESPSEDSMTVDLKHATKCLLECGHSPTYYCRKHKIFCCRALSQLHCHCEDMVYLEERLIYRHRETDIQETKKLLSALDKILEEETTSIIQVKQKAKKFLTKAKNNIAASNQQDNEFEDIQDKVDKNQIKVIQVHVDRIVALQKHRGIICDYLQTLENVNLSPLQSIIARHKDFSLAQAQVEGGLKALTSDILEMKMSIHESNTTRFDVSIEPKKPELSAFVSLFNGTLTSLFNHLFNKCTAQEGRKLLIESDITFVASVERSTIEAGMIIPDGTYLPDNTILLCDQENSQLIKLDENLGFLEKLPVAGEPSGVCVGSDDNHVLVVCDNEIVVTYSLQGPWREINRFETATEAQGIACHGDRIATGSGHDVEIFDSKGIPISWIHTLGGSFYPALSHDGSMLYHDDGCTDVFCETIEDPTPNVWSYLLDDEFGFPCGIDTDRDGNIMLLGEDSPQIYQISNYREQKRKIVDRMKFMEGPQGLFCNRKNNTFCVTSSYSCDTVCVEMYRFDD